MVELLYRFLPFFLFCEEGVERRYVAEMTCVLDCQCSLNLCLKARCAIPNLCYGVWAELF